MTTEDLARRMQQKSIQDKNNTKRQVIKGETYPNRSIELDKIIGKVGIILTGIVVAGGIITVVGFTNKLNDVSYAKALAKKAIEEDNKDDIVRSEKLKEEIDNLQYDSKDLVGIYNKIFDSFNSDDFKLMTGEFNDGVDVVEIEIMGDKDKITKESAIKVVADSNSIGEGKSEKEAAAIVGLENFILDTALDNYKAHEPRIK